MALILGVMLRESIAARRQGLVPGRFLFVGGVIFPLAAVSAGLTLSLPEAPTAEAFVAEALPDAPRPFPLARPDEARAPPAVFGAAADSPISHAN